MKSNSFPNPPEDLMDKIKDRLIESQKRKQHKKRRLVFVMAVVMVFILPISAYSLVNRYWGFTHGVKIAIDNNEGLAVNKELKYKDARVTIENVVWEEDELAITYSTNDSGYILGQVALVDENGNQISRGGQASSDMTGGVMNFSGLTPEALKNDKVWLRIYSIINMEHTLKGGKNPSFPYLEIETSEEMKDGGFVDINQELEVEQGTFLFNYMGFGKTKTTLNFQFVPAKEYQEFYNSQLNTELVPKVVLNAKGKSYPTQGMSINNSSLSGSISFDTLPIEELNSFRIAVVDNFALVNWKIPIEVQKKKAEVIELTKDINLPEGKLTLSEVRLDTKSTTLNFSFEPAEGFEEINRVYFKAYLRNGDKYYNMYSFDHTDQIPGLKGTIKFDPVKYDDVEELEFILGSIEYTYESDSTGVTISQNNLPQTISALGNTFIIDKMELKDGKTWLNVDFGSKNRNFYDAKVDIRIIKAANLSYQGEFNEDYLEFKDQERLEQGLEKLKNNLGNYGGELLKNVDLNRGIIGKHYQINGEHKEIEVNIRNITTKFFSGEIITLPVKTAQ